jgi:hypothetical protein
MVCKAEPAIGTGLAGRLARQPAIRDVHVAATACLEEDSLLGCKQRELTPHEPLPEIPIEGHEVLTAMRHG